MTKALAHELLGNGLVIYGEDDSDALNKSATLRQFEDWYRDLPASSCSRFVTATHLMSDRLGTLRSTGGRVLGSDPQWHE